MQSREKNPAPETWTRAVEQLVLPILEGRVRVLGVTSPEEGAGASTLSGAAACALARSGLKVLLIDLSPRTAAEQAKAWVPGESGAASYVRPHAAGYDVLTAVVTPETRFLFNNGQRLRSTLTGDLGDYGAVIVDLPPLLDDERDGVNALAAALVCDQVLLVCANRRTARSDARAATELARSNGVRLSGVVWNNFGEMGLGEEIATTIKRRLRFVPGMARFADRRIARSTFLNG
jgi:Mrp family chromosome partitioning ATPase